MQSDWTQLIHPGPGTREREYSPSSCIGGNYQPFLAAYRDQSAAAMAESQAQGARWTRIAYGLRASQTVLLCQAPASAKPQSLLVYIHGGYWQELDAASSVWAASECVRRGHAFASIDYTLAPHARLGDIVQECRAAVAHLLNRAESLGLDASHVVLAGSSAGAHLAACVALPCPADAHQTAPAPGLGRVAPKPNDLAWRPRGLILASGVYWVAPLVDTSINDALGLDSAEARAWSPGEALASAALPSLLAWGDNETQAFKAQSESMAIHLRRQGHPVSTLEVPGRNHFDVILDLCDPHTEMGRQTLGWLGFCRPDS